MTNTTDTSPEALAAQGIVTIEEREYFVPKQRKWVRLKYLFQTWEQYKAQDLDALLGADYTPEGIERFKAWCKQRRVHYYAAPKEDFFPFVAFEEASLAGAEFVMMENLS